MVRRPARKVLEVVWYQVATGTGVLIKHPTVKNPSPAPCRLWLVSCLSSVPTVSDCTWGYLLSLYPVCTLSDCSLVSGSELPSLKICFLKRMFLQAPSENLLF